MGYKGAPKGLLDPDVNLTYAIPYLANAWMLADGNESRAVSLYSGGYYYLAKRRKMLPALRTASSPPMIKPQKAPEPAAPPPEPPSNPIAGLFQFLASHSADAGAAGGASAAGAVSALSDQ
jgi:hypothetical protein